MKKVVHCSFLLFWVFLFVVLVGVEGEAAIRHVPGDYSTIQEAVDAASYGDDIQVAAGIYNEVVYINKYVSLIGAGASQTTIDASGLSDTNSVTFDGNSTDLASISGFNITGATGSGANGNGIYCNNGAGPTIANNTITGNSAEGIDCRNYSDPTITDNTITGNSGSGIYCNYSPPTIENNKITGNNSHGIYCNYSSPIVANNIITENSENGIYCHSSSPTIANNTIIKNSEHGIYCYWYSSPTIANNIVTENSQTSASYYGIKQASSSNPYIDYNDVCSNGAPGTNNYSGCTPGNNDISEYPYFIGEDNYRLQSTSPCIDAGTNIVTGIIIPPTDKDGNPRIVNGIIDIGAYEYQGNGTPPAISLSPTSLTFSAQHGGTNPASQTFNITNTGGGSLNWTASDNTAWLSLLPTSGTGNATVTVSVDISGLSVGPHNATITVSDAAASNSPQTVVVALSVIDGTQPQISVTPTSHNFGSVTVGSSSSKTFTVSNTGTADLLIGVINLTGADDFSLQNDNCSNQTISPGGNRTLQVVFTPGSTGAKTATLSIPSNDQTLLVPLTGEGVPATNRVVRVISTSASPGSTVSVPIELEAQGDENALGFSLTFDENVLSNPQATPGKDASSATLNTNSSQISTGHYGIALALPPGEVFAAGGREIVVVNFSITSGIANTSTTIGFGDQPIGREVVDVDANILSAAWISGTVTITSGYEADVAPRPNGNNEVTIADWVQVGRFAAGLDEVNIGSEFQRADCAPKGTLGNGEVTIADWVQAGRYAARLDALTPAGGPTSPALPAQSLAALKAFARANPERTVRAVKTTFESNKVNSLIVELDAQGDENALGFSLIYGTNFLTFEEAILANAASGALLLKNTNQLADGRLGIALALPAGQTFSAGTLAIVEISFKASKVDSPVTTQVSFGDQPIGREVVDVNASSVSASYADASVTITPQGASVSGDVVIYPNPFRPGEDTVMRFEGLPENASIRIYNIAGELVRSKEDITTGLFSWDATNDKEKKVASGVYIYVIKDAKGKVERGKIAVIR